MFGSLYVSVISAANNSVVFLYRSVSLIQSGSGLTEVDVFNRYLKGILLAATVVLATAIPASAQSLGVGISFLGDEGGTGFIVDYARPSKTVNTDQTLSWVGDFSFFHNGFEFTDSSINTLMVQGGARISGKAGEKAMWDGQGLIGIRHSSVGGTVGSICGLSGVDCDDTGGVLTVGGGLEYAFGTNKAVRGQLDFPIALGEGGNTTRFSIMYIIQMKK